MQRLLITGAAGGLGTMARRRLTHLAPVLRVADVVPVKDPAPNEEVVQCDLADRDAVDRMVAGCDGIVHFGGISVEDKFSKILDANIIGVFNLYEAARAHGHPRIIFASSNHAVGFHPQDRRLTASDPIKPDGLYGVSKCYGEAMASMYHSKFGQETAIVRIGSCFDKPANHRMMATWFSRDDFVRLAETVFRVRRLGCPIIWGVSDNDECWWDNGEARYLGWRPRDNSARFRDEIEREHPRPAPDDPTSLWQGGTFTQDPIFPED